MSSTEIKLNARTEALSRLPWRIAKAFDHAREEMHVWAIGAHGEFVATHLSGNPIHRWTGQLERSFQPVWSTSPASFRAGVAFAPTMTGPNGTFPNYARILEEGGTITPKNGRLLAWPVKGGPAVTAAGIPRYAGPRQYPGKLFFYRSKGGGMFLAEKNGDGLKCVYVLARGVTIKARMGFRAWAEEKQQEGKETCWKAFKEGLV